MSYEVPNDDSTLALSEGQRVMRPGDRVLVQALAPTWMRAPRDGRPGQSCAVYCAAGSAACDVQSFTGALLAALAPGQFVTLIRERATPAWTPYTGGGAAAVPATPTTTTITTLGDVATTPVTDGNFLIVNDPANPPIRRYEGIGGVWVEQGGTGGGGTSTQTLANLPASVWTAFAPATGLAGIQDYAIFDAGGNDITAGLSTRIAGLAVEAFSLVPLTSLTIRYTGA